MKKVILLIFIFLAVSLQSFATYKIIDEKEYYKEGTKEYQEILDKITPEMLGIRPTTDKAEYSEENLVDYSPKGHLINDHEENFINYKNESNDSFFIIGIIIFILLLISPLVLIFLLGTHPEWQAKISAFVDTHKKKILINIVILGVFIYAIIGISAANEGGLITFIQATFETFGGYFVIAIIFSLIVGVFSKLKK